MPASQAAAALQGGSDFPEIRGTLRFSPCRGGVWVEAAVTGLPGDGFFALHIHQGTDCGGTDFAHTQGHFSPLPAPHPEHAGDLPPLLSCGGCARMGVLTSRFTVPEILGRTVVIHRNADDFHTQPAGASGEKIACGVIRREGCYSR